jgi:hypothetical protein
MNLIVNQINPAKTNAWAKSVRLMFIRPPAPTSVFLAELR